MIRGNLWWSLSMVQEPKGEEDEQLKYGGDPFSEFYVKIRGGSSFILSYILCTCNSPWRVRRFTKL